MSIMLKKSGVGVRTAERMAMSKIAYRRFRVKKAAVTNRMALNKARMSGSSKMMPKAKMNAVQKEMYFPAEIIGLI